MSTRRNRHPSPIDAGEWVGGQLPAPAYVTAGDPYRVEIILWLEVPGDVVVGTEVVDPRAPASVTQILVRSMAQPLVGPPRRPTRIRVADAALAVELRAVVPDIDVIVAPTPELHAVLAQMAATMPASDEAGELSRGGARARRRRRDAVPRRGDALSPRPVEDRERRPGPPRRHSCARGPRGVPVHHRRPRGKPRVRALPVAGGLRGVRRCGRRAPP